MNRPSSRNIILLALLLVQIIAALLLSRHSTSLATGTSQHRQLLPSYNLDEIQQVAITDERGKTVLMQKEGPAWVLPALNNYPVNSRTFKKLIGNLLAVSSNYLVSSSRQQQVALAVSENKFRRRIQIVGENNSQTIFIGNGQNSSYCHVRLDGSDQIWGIENITEWQYPAEPLEWADTVYISLPPEQLTYLSIDGNSYNMTVERTPGEAWHWPGRQMAEKFPPDQAQIERLADELSSLEINGVSGTIGQPEFAALLHDDKTLTITLRADRGYQFYLLPQGDSSTLLYKQGASHVVTVDNWHLGTFYGVINAH